MTETTPPQVAATAAQTDALPLNELALIGIFNKPDGNSALLRTGRGKILALGTGETSDGYRIAAIDETTVVVIDSLGRDLVLTMPG